MLARSLLLFLLMVVGGFDALAAASSKEKIEQPFRRRIVGGEKTDINQHPWQVALQFRGQFFCGGSIIAEKWILTAAHCFEGGFDAQGDWRSKAGATDYSGSRGWLEAQRIVVYPDYKGKPTYENDLALVKMKVPPAGRVIPLASRSAIVPEGQPLEVTGWGAVSEHGSGSKTLLKATVPRVSTTECNAPQSYNGAIRDGMMCAGRREGGIDSCNGDSGGPLVWRTSDGPVLVGVVSFGRGCARELKYGVYTKVSAYRDWIDRTITADGD
jgi:secreted trypsin-like serine protease